ncbi:MAG: hypothetical protein HYT87_19665 [Nitrospirae bacterium]|nr:hypothetical protein [Nitrospirota bacterium]
MNIRQLLPGPTTLYLSQGRTWIPRSTALVVLLLFFSNSIVGCSKKAKEPQTVSHESFDTDLVLGDGAEEGGWKIAQNISTTTKSENQLKYEVRDGKLEISGAVSAKDKLIVSQTVKADPETIIDIQVSHRMSATLPSLLNTIIPDPVLRTENPLPSPQAPSIPPAGLVALVDTVSKTGVSFLVFPEQVMVMVDRISPPVFGAPPSIDTPPEGEPPVRRTGGIAPAVPRIVRSITRGSWHRYRIVYDPVAFKVKMFVDGSQVAGEENVMIPKPVFSMGTMAGPNAKPLEATIDGALFDDLEIKR